ncbi:MAG: hypothetical protein SH817_13500 [Leptospira sp.]|nr:hypothetical protein [Leptospira sp.]
MIGTILTFPFAFPMSKILYVLPFLVFFFSCQGDGHFSKETYAFDRITVAHLPERVPSAIPRSFIPSTVTYINSVELRSGFSNPRESYLSLESNLSVSEIKDTIEKRSSLGDWKIIQKDELGNKTSYLFEGFIKKSLSIFVYDLGEKRIVKYFFKKQSTY